MDKQDIEERLKQYADSLRSMDTDRWLAEYAEDASVEDPVGTPAMVGHEQLRVFFDGLRENIEVLDMKPEVTIIIPPEAALKSTVTATAVNGSKADFELINTFKFREEDGKVVEMRAFWDAEKLAKALKA